MDILLTPNFSSNSEPWYVVHCKPRKEFYAANTLRNNFGIFVFLPESRRRLRGEVQRIPFFPGYLFAQVDLEKVPPSRINTSPGVLRLVEFGGDPQPVPHSVVEAIFEEMNRPNTLSHLSHYSFSAGDLVRIKNGPLQDLEMVFIEPMAGSERVRVLLHFLGRLKEVDADVDALEKMPSNSNLQRERYTRGRGRRIKR